MFFKIVIILSILFLGFTISAQEDIYFDIKKIDNGNFKIIWEAPENSDVYISFLGRQETKGEQIVKPEYNYNYTIVAEKDSNILYSSKIIEAGGVRGDGTCPSQSIYSQYVYRYQVSNSVQSVLFLEAVRNVLQEKMNFSLLEDHYNASNSQYMFETSCSQRDYLLDPDETTLAGRRIAYKLDIVFSNPSEEIIYYISCAIQYRKKVVKTWRKEDNEKLHLKEARRLRENLDNYISNIND